MANVAHADLTGANLHEPKGVASASADKIYVADGAGSGQWEYSPGMAYGEIYIVGGSTAFTLDAASAYSRLDPGTDWTANGYRNVTLDPTDGEMVVLIDGTYKLDFWINFTTAAIASGTKYNFKYAVNGVTSTRTLSVEKTSNGADQLHVSGSGIATFAANDIISIYVGGDGTSSGTNITASQAGFNLILLKNT